ncbi:hypothetical protein PC128_g19166 [Phytophthora cactorum]|nr:hypothetical protein PC128_g19166 [Phytophthora cactorum]
MVDWTEPLASMQYWLASIQSLPGALSDLPRVVDELQASRRSCCCCCPAFYGPCYYGQESAEQYLRTANAQIETYQIDIECLRETNDRNDALLAQTKVTIAKHNEDLELLRFQNKDRDAHLPGQDKADH